MLPHTIHQYVSYTKCPIIQRSIQIYVYICGQAFSACQVHTNKSWKNNLSISLIYTNLLYTSNDLEYKAHPTWRFISSTFTFSLCNTLTVPLFKEWVYQHGGVCAWNSQTNFSASAHTTHGDISPPLPNSESVPTCYTKYSTTRINCGNFDRVKIPHGKPDGPFVLKEEVKIYKPPSTPFTSCVRICTTVLALHPKYCMITNKDKLLTTLGGNSSTRWFCTLSNQSCGHNAPLSCYYTYNFCIPFI